MPATHTYTVMDYLLDRLAELGVDRLFGVPGDFTLGLLDHVLAHERMSWTGCTNELNAGYAADGYARLRGAGALMTTFGVGELSAVNAIAGSYAEHVPVLHLVGGPATGTQRTGRKIHHTLGDGDFHRFADMYERVTCAAAHLDAGNAREEIDRVLSAMREQRRPGYLLLPLDVAELPVARPTAALPVAVGRADGLALAGFAEAAAGLLDRAPAADVTVLSGVLTHRLGAEAELNGLLAAAPVRSATTLWGKSTIDESRPHHVGVYVGAASNAAVRRAVLDAGTLVVAGVEVTDLNSGFFTNDFPAARTIELDATSARVGGRTFAGVPLRRALAVLADLLVTRRVAAPHEVSRPAVRPRAATGRLEQQSLWPTVAEFLRPGDIVLADQGTAFYGIAAQRLPRDVTFIGQPLWASIGYTLPAALGAGLAEPGRRVVLLIGDGAAQMTVTELSTMARQGLRVTVLVVDNDGYTIERAIHGPDEVYNDIPQWDWTALARALTGVPAERAVRVESVDDLRRALTAAEGLSFVQAVLPRLDLPQLLTDLAQAAGAANAQPAVAS